MEKWYLYENEEVVGPFSVEQLGDRINKETLVCRAGEEEWNEARDVDELQQIFEEDDSGLRMASSPDQSATDRTDSDDLNEDSTTKSESAQEFVEDDSTQESNDVLPTLDELLRICQHAKNQELVTEFEEHWAEYDSAEKRVIRNEMKSRGIFNETKNGASE